MLTVRENLLETIRGGQPDRFVRQFEFLKMMGNPFSLYNKNPKRGEHNVVNAWGITRSFPENTPGAFPVHTPEKVVIKDINHWRDYVHAPVVKWSDEEWEPFIEAAEKIDRTQYFASASVAPGIFEQCHHLGEIQKTLVNLYEDPDDMHDLIRYLTDFELRLADEICAHLHPDALFHHDDWGTQLSTFMSPEMFDDFYLEPYKEVYNFYRSRGVKLIVHHSDSYAATLVPEMIEIGIDIWQGVMTTNHIRDLIAQYGGKISFMGGIDSAAVDRPDWTPEMCAAEVRRACTEYGKLYFIPCTTMGGPASVFPGVYDTVGNEIDKMSAELF